MLEYFGELINQFNSSSSDLDKIFSAKSRSRGIPDFTDREFLYNLELEKPELLEARRWLERRDYEKSGNALLKYYRFRNLPIFLPGNNDQAKIFDIYKKYFARSAPKLVSQTDKYCQNEFTLPWVGDFSFQNAIDWFSDFKGSTLIYGHLDELGQLLETADLKKAYPLLYLNTHIHFQKLGRSFWLTGDEKYAKAFINQSSDWLARNPVHMGINWLSEDFVGRRALNWALSLGYFMDYPGIEGEFFLKYLKTLFLHAAYASRQLKHKDSLALASSLYVISYLFPEFKASQGWQTQAANFLQTRITQVLDGDGVSREPSITAHLLNLYYLTLPMLVGFLHGDSFPADYQDLAEKGLEYLHYLMPPGGSLPLIGQVTPGSVFALEAAPDYDAQVLLGLGTLLFNRGDFKTSALGGAAELLWLAGSSGWEKFLGINSLETPQTGKFFADSGQVISRTGWGERDSWLYLSLGRNSDHQDLHNLLFYAQGEPVLIEGGDGCENPAFKNYLNTPDVHNRVWPEGIKPQTPKISKPEVKFSPQVDYFSGRFSFAPEGGTDFNIRREVLLEKEKNWLVIKDSVEGVGKNLLAHYLNFYPNLDITVRGDMGSLLRGKHLRARHSCFFEGKFQAKLLSGNHEPIEGWFSDARGNLYPSIQLKYSYNALLPTKIYTWLSWSPMDFKSPETHELETLFSIAKGQPVPA